jgi:hypothetical protein
MGISLKEGASAAVLCTGTCFSSCFFLSFLSFFLSFFSHFQFLFGLYFTREIVTTPETIIVVLSMAGVIWEEVMLFPMDCELANSLKLPLVRMLESILHFVTQT